MLRNVFAIDSHTGGEPTRVVVRGGPDLGGGSVAQQAECFRDSHDAFRRFVVNEPRGAEVLVGALLCPPADPRCQFGVIFFNNVGLLGMCGHGTIGLMATLMHLGQISPGTYSIETPVGVITATLHDAATVSLNNVPSYRLVAEQTVTTKRFGPITGEIAWGGNWFYLAKSPGIELELCNIEALTDLTWEIRQTLEATNIRGSNGGVIDHIELFSKPHDSANHSRNFVLCPGKAYDRSPCGTGTSAKLACLAAAGALAPGQLWRQESILGTVFEGYYHPAPTPTQIIPTIPGTAYITAELKMIATANDPFADGI